MNIQYSVLLIVVASATTFGQVFTELHNSGIINENSGYLVIGNTGNPLIATGSENFVLQNLVDKALGWVKINLTAMEEACNLEDFNISNCVCFLEDLLDFAIDPAAVAFARWCLMKFSMYGHLLSNIFAALMVCTNREWVAFRKNRLKNFRTRVKERHFYGEGLAYSALVLSHQEHIRGQLWRRLCSTAELSNNPTLQPQLSFS